MVSFTLQVGDCDPSITSSSSYTLELIDPCSSATLQFSKSPFPSTGDSFTYAVGDAQEDFSFLDSDVVIQGVNAAVSCGVLTYSVLDSSDTPVDGTVFSFDDSNKIVSVFTNDPNEAGIYPLKLVMQLLDYPSISGEFSFTMVVEVLCLDATIWFNTLGF